MTNDFSFSDLEEMPIASASSKPRADYPCGQCAGTGRYHMRNGTVGTCFCCKGTGRIAKPYKDVLAAKAKRQDAANDRMYRVRSEFNEQHADLHRRLCEMMDWNDFARSMVDQINHGGRPLSERQLEACYAMVAKVDAKRAEKAAARTTELGGDLSVLRDLISRAIENGKTKPTYRAKGLTVSQAPARGANAGALYVKSTETGTYFGKIVGGKFAASRDAEADVAAKLIEIAADPKAAAVAYGREIKACFCCGARLTNPLSVELGIGPICRGKWGF
jgi:hypothetical protein